MAPCKGSFLDGGSPAWLLFSQVGGSCSRPPGSIDASSCRRREMRLLFQSPAAMFWDIYDRSLGRRCCWLLNILLLLLLLFSFWFCITSDRWRRGIPLSCRPQGASTNLSTGSLSLRGLYKDITLQRMLYEQPDALKPLRTDISMMTPWFAPIVWSDTYNIDILNAQFHQRNIRIGLTVFAIKKYTVFVRTFIETAEKYFMVGHKVTYYVFTDRVSDIPIMELAEGRRLMVLRAPTYQRWQDVSMRRMEILRDYSLQRFMDEVDYLVCVDVDMSFHDEVGVETLSDLFGTLHPGMYGLTRNNYTYERNSQSEAYISLDEGDFYYAGGYFGGNVEEVYKLTSFCHNAMMVDKAKNIEAIWHDESYLNKYFLYHKPTKILSPEYLWDNGFGIPKFLKRRRFLAVPKDHNEIRN